MIYRSVEFNSMMDLYLKGIHLKPSREYAFTLDIFGGCINVYISAFGIRQGSGSHYVERSDRWQTHTFRFQTKEKFDSDSDLLFSEWGISFVKKYGEILPTASEDTYIGNVKLIDLTEGNSLIAGGDFSLPEGHIIYTTNWEPELLGKKGKKLGVAIVSDPCSVGGHCLLLPRTMNPALYPSTLPLAVETCGMVKNNALEPIKHTHYAGHLLLLVKKGRADFSIDGTSFYVSDEQIAYLPPNSLVQFVMHPAEKTEYYWLEVSGVYMTALLAECGFTKQAILPVFNASALIVPLRAMLQIDKERVTSLYAAAGQLQLFLAEWEKQQRRLPGIHLAKIEAIADKIQKYPENPVSNEALASELEISAKHFISLFKSYMGMPPQKYRLHALVAKACLLMQDTTMTVSEIAHALNFDDPLYFSRVFTGIQGISPRNYRKRLGL